ncbi:MAG TPA: hypothetical protein VET23_06260 [Chitinophagaceae bacterium]|nr:hypothetical protein [Chitinophagaceae bacterium]
MIFVVTILTLILQGDNPIPSSNAFIVKNSLDSLHILVTIKYPDDFPDNLKKNSFLWEQVIADFKQREKKRQQKFRLIGDQDSTIHYDYALNFFLVDSHFGEEKTDQSMRMATMKKIVTVYDVEAGQHKRADLDYSADVTRTKNSVNCTGSIVLTINESGDDSLLLKKLFYGKYTWQNEYVTFQGDKEALSNEELQLSRNRAQEPPTRKDLFQALLEIIYRDISAALDSFFKVKKGF